VNFIQDDIHSERMAHLIPPDKTGGASCWKLGTGKARLMLASLSSRTAAKIENISIRRVILFSQIARRRTNFLDKIENIATYDRSLCSLRHAKGDEFCSSPLA